MNPLQIDGRPIGPGAPTFVIAEIGVNHDGSAQKAMELVRIAANCGATAVKLQIFRAANLLHGSATLAAYQKERARETSSMDMLRKYELPADDLRKIVKGIRDLKMVPLATPFSLPDIELIDSLRLPAVKIASPDVVNRPLLYRAAQLGRPMLLSTGGAELAELDRSVEWLRQWKSTFALLHCICAYPTPAAQANLSWIHELSARFDVITGYSDHTTEVMSGALAASAGAYIVERHLTYDRNARGPDHAASSDPTQFERYVKLIREADVMRGIPGKRVLEIEQDVRTSSRQSLVVRRSIRPGEVIRAEDLTIQRPGTGIPAAQIEEVVGRTSLKAIPAGTMAQWDMIAPAGSAPANALPQVA
jgi:N,N'-diacetyllegionaminate synthase